MNDEDFERAFEVREQLMKEIETLVNERLENETPEVEEMIREQLLENMRYWK